MVKTEFWDTGLCWELEGETKLNENNKKLLMPKVTEELLYSAI